MRDLIFLTHRHNREYVLSRGTHHFDLNVTMCLLITVLFSIFTIISAQNRIIGGTDVSAGTYPWFAHAINGSCGGILIAANWVLTAAHCPAPSSYTIGALDYSDTSNGGQFLQVISVSQTIQHPLYGDQNYPQDSFDFRLNVLFQSSTIDPVDIDSENLSDAYHSGKILKAIGFGNTNIENPYYPIHLQHVDVSYMTNEECQSSNYPAFWISDSMMCAGSSGYDACQGDSGGPLFDVSTQKVVGIVSWGISCAVDGNPGVYARISNQFQWIKSIVCDSNQTTIKPSWCFESTDEPTSQPSKRPTLNPSSYPTHVPSLSPSRSFPPSTSIHPTIIPTREPSWKPSVRPTIEPSHRPSLLPTASHTNAPSENPSNMPSDIPSDFPSSIPAVSLAPSVTSSVHPSMVSSNSVKPTPHPSILPSNSPSSQPTITSSSTPSYPPTNLPSFHPSIYYMAVTSTFLEMDIPISCPFHETQKNDLEQALINSITQLLARPGTMTNLTISVINDVICTTDEQQHSKRALEDEEGEEEVGLTLIVSIQSISRNSRYIPLSAHDIIRIVEFDLNSNNSTILFQVMEIMDQSIETMIMVRVIDSPSSSPSSIPSSTFPSSSGGGRTSHFLKYRNGLSTIIWMFWMGIFIL